ncbi:hypothetical protein QBC38DRAFT_483401 [Podospora fimiseda]|uniref:Uncharacterized protein n=1 Tax=Podospora fimiseda TaxID=252190 RepID=A0AAN7BL72_9PEZI|nr:hypothetical protein QBC38DRAFT_483401 [Podospora fimiseda]
MEAFDSDIIYQWEAKQSFPPDELFRSTTVDLLQVLVGADGVPYSSIRSLRPSEFQKYLVSDDPEEPANEGTSTGTLHRRMRLVIAACDERQHPTKSNPTLRGSGFPKRALKAHYYPPILRQDLEMLQAKFKLPPSTTMIASAYEPPYNEAHFHFSPFTDPLPDTIGITMVLPGSSLLGTSASVFISHSLSTKSTNALLLCRHWHHAQYISDMIMDLPGLMTHPAAIPTMLCNLLQTRLLEEIGRTWHRVFDVELGSGQSGIQIVSPSEGVLPAGMCDDPDLSRRAIAVTQMAAAWNSYAPRSQALIYAVKTFLQESDGNRGRQDDDTLSKQSTILQDYLERSSQRAEMVCHSVKHLLGRAQIQMEAINNHLAHTSNEINRSLAESSRKIAIQTQRDSSAMKSIAVLTMTFLPATFIASLFATPGISGTNPPQSLYWAVTVPVTVLVLAIWSGWIYLTTYKMQKLADNVKASTSRPNPRPPVESVNDFLPSMEFREWPDELPEPYNLPGWTASAISRDRQTSIFRAQSRQRRYRERQRD